MKRKDLPVIFRKYPEGSIIAVFPTIPADISGITITSYMHIGQHCQACPQGVIRTTKPTTPREYKELITELHKIGYRNLKVYKRLLYKHLEEMRKTAKEYK